MISTVTPRSIEERLQARRSELRQRLERVEVDRSHRQAPLSADFGEQANESGNDEVLTAIGGSAGDELARIDHALQRMHAGLYGRCEKCNDPIDLQRLRAVPEAVTCRACA
jgi:DnaK suppressor protein